jgi:PST family polysaccharide transporter
MEQLKQKAVRGIAWLAIGNWSDQIASFLVLIVLTRILGPEAFGLIGMATVFTAFVGLFAEQGLGRAIVQRKDLEDAHLYTAFWTNLAVGLALTLFGFLMSPVVAHLYKEPKIAPIAAVLSINFLLTALSSTQHALFERDLNFRILSTRRLLAAVAGGIAAILAAFLGAGVYALVTKTLVTGLTGVILLWWVSAWRPKFKYSKRHFNEIFSFGANLIGVRITNFIRTRLDDFLIGFFLGPIALGYYIVAYRLARLALEMLTGLIGGVAITTFAKLQDDLIRLRRAFMKTTQFVSLITFPIFTGMMILAPDLILFFSGEKWLPSVLPMRILSIASFSLTMQFMNSYVIISTGRPAKLLRINIVCALITVLAFSLCAQFGIIYMAIAYTVVNVSFFFVYLLSAHRIIEIDLKSYFTQMLWPMLGSGIMAIAVLTLSSLLSHLEITLWIKILMAMSLAVFTYSLSMIFLQRSVLSDFREAVLTFLPVRSSLRERIQE